MLEINYFSNKFTYFIHIKFHIYILQTYLFCRFINIIRFGIVLNYDKLYGNDVTVLILNMQ